MEATAQSVEDYLIDALSFKLKPGASYITNRRSVTYLPIGGKQYSTTGVKVIQILINGRSMARSRNGPSPIHAGQ